MLPSNVTIKFPLLLPLRALARIGNVYVKQEKWELAVKYFDKSLADHRNPDIVNKKREVCLCVRIGEKGRGIPCIGTSMPKNEIVAPLQVATLTVIRELQYEITLCI